MAAQGELRHGACPQFQHSPVWGHGVTAGPWLCAVTSQPDPAARSRPGSAAQPLLFPAQEHSRSPARLTAEHSSPAGSPACPRGRQGGRPRLALLRAPRARAARAAAPMGAAAWAGTDCCIPPGRSGTKHRFGLDPFLPGGKAPWGREESVPLLPAGNGRECRYESPRWVCCCSATSPRPHRSPREGSGGVGCGAAPGPGTRSAAQLGPVKPAQLPARAPYVQPCHTEGRAALGGTDLSSTCRQNPTLPGRSAVLEVGGCRQPSSPYCSPTAARTARSLHLAVAEDLAEVVAGHCKGVSLGVTETGAADLGVGDALSVAVLDLHRGVERGAVK